MSTYTRKTKDVFVIQGNYGYGHGYEDLFETDNRKDARSILKDYQDNEPSASHRLICRRVKLEPVTA